MTDQAALAQIKRFIFAETGLTYYRQRDAELTRKIDQARRRAGERSYQRYLARLEAERTQGGDALDDLVASLTVGETYFFRNQAHFNALQTVILPAVIQKNRSSRKLWIWSAGCATGEEIYSIAIVLHTHFTSQLQGWDIRLNGTDINRDFLRRAQAGQYTEWSFRGVSPDIQQTCFTSRGAARQIDPVYQRHTTFQYHNLINMPFPSMVHGLFEFDIIFCRNVMIYLDDASIHHLVQGCQRALAPDGWLIVGHADHSLTHFKSFTAVMHPGATLYRNRPPRPQPPAEPVIRAGRPTVVNRPVSPPTAPPIAHRRPPAPPPLNLRLARAVDQGDWAMAATLSHRMRVEQPLQAISHFYAAIVAEQQGRSGEAIAALKKALYLDRGFVVGHYHLGLLLQQSGNRQQACKSFGNVIDLLAAYDPDHVFNLADGISARQLMRLSRFHIEVMGK